MSETRPDPDRKNYSLCTLLFLSENNQFQEIGWGVAMQHIHVFLTGSKTFWDITPIESYLYSLMTTDECNTHQFTLLHSGFKGAETLGAFVAETMGWQTILVCLFPT